MSKKFGYIILLVILISFIGASYAPCKTSKRPALLLKKADQCRRTLYSSTKKIKYRHNWLNCIGRYKKVYKSYPKSDQAIWAIYKSANLFTGLYTYSGKSKDLDNALYFYRLASKYKDHRLADDAQYMIGMIYYKHKKDMSQAYVEFLKVDIKFPSGDMQPKATKMVNKLAVVLGKNGSRKTKKNSAKPKSKLTAVKDIRHWSTPNYTRVVVDLENPVKYKHNLLKANPNLKKPRRLYLDLKKAYVSTKINAAISIKDGLLQGARVGQYSSDTVRVVLDIEELGGYKVFPLHDPFRIVVDVRKFKKDGAKKKPRPAIKKRPVEKGIKKAKTPDKNISLARQLGLNVDRIVIDPGHGGKDPGCRYSKGVNEKGIVLSMAKLLAKELRKEIGCEVYLTRSKDVFLTLERRTAIANMKKADLFISLHINAHRNKNIRGLETYYLNMATDERSVLVAARENATSEKNISDLQSILNDLMLNTKIHESSRLAHAVQKGIVTEAQKRYKYVKDLGVKQAPFYVMIGAHMPAVLVEAGFLTNSTERKRLLSKTYQDKMIKGIAKGIKAYMKSIDQAYKGG
ncbi:MAG: AMIN domain-containing protein [Desulfobacterales bacterium]|nr:AMIN domain-containing protein [Desulfobacterales bacterium]